MYIPSMYEQTDERIIDLSSSRSCSLVRKLQCKDLTEGAYCPATSSVFPELQYTDTVRRSFGSVRAYWKRGPIGYRVASVGDTVRRSSYGIGESLQTSRHGGPSILQMIARTCKSCKTDQVVYPHRSMNIGQTGCDCDQQPEACLRRRHPWARSSCSVG
jgi:hypothetical protein